jgi:hypothetical protein
MVTLLPPRSNEPPRESPPEPSELKLVKLTFPPGIDTAPLYPEFALPKVDVPLTVKGFAPVSATL